MKKHFGKHYIAWRRFTRTFLPRIGDCPEASTLWEGFAIYDYRRIWNTVCLPALNENRLWSCCIQDNCWYVVPGNHFVNREAVIITSVPYPPEVENLYVPY